MRAEAEIVVHPTLTNMAAPWSAMFRAGPYRNDFSQP